MREIKHRGKHRELSYWVHGDLLTKYIHHQGLTIVVHGCIYYEVDPATVGQFINHKDDNQRDIYKGDICKITQACGEVYIAAVVWDEIELCWALDIGCELIPFNVVIHCLHGVEVIGNIYDNPGLLE